MYRFTEELGWEQEARFDLSDGDLNTGMAILPDWMVVIKVDDNASSTFQTLVGNRGTTLRWYYLGE